LKHFLELLDEDRVADTEYVCALLDQIFDEETDKNEDVHNRG
jgi:hypothetical protein